MVFSSVTDQVMFKVRVGTVSNYIALSNVLPADEMGSMDLLSSVTKVKATTIARVLRRSALKYCGTRTVNVRLVAYLRLFFLRRLG